jgi:uncharacterized membrane protein YfcA
MIDISIFLDFHTAIIIGLIYIFIHVVKSLTSAYCPKLRKDARFKKVVLPLLGVTLGALLSLILAPELLDSFYEKLGYGFIVGYFWTYLYSSLKTLLPFENKLEQKLKDSIRPPGGTNV